ncbi:MAG: triple tyrosine motif-containing protein [Bacteroidia bacterium]|nr:triple tyrosine motif-containing protein [Bacteroidia bacterium]
MKKFLFQVISIIFLLAMTEVAALAEIKDIGTPFIRNFSKHEYRAGTQNWAVAQDQKGFMYFANNEGLLVFDGVRWELYRMPNLSMVRSIYIDDKDEIYIGAFNELGKMVPDENGKLVYYSLKDKIPPENQNFDDVWNIFPYKDMIVFQSYNAAYVLKKGNEFTVIPSPVRFPNAYNAAGRIFFYDSENGIFEFDGTRMVPLKGCEKLKGEEINSIMPYRNAGNLLICTLDKGLFLYDGNELSEWNVQVNEILRSSQVFSATTLQDNYYALGTIQDGVIIIDSDGNLIQHINQKKGLQNNTILKIFSDRTDNLWLGLDNGIDYVIVNSPITFLQRPDGFGAGYCELIYKNKLYLGTNQGLFVQDWIDGKTQNIPKMIPGTYGQVWYLGVHNGVILCGHNKGTYIIDGENAVHITNIPGGWKYHIMKRFPGYLLGGTFGGLILFKWENGTWKFVRKIPGFNESFRVFEEDDNGDLWLSHAFKGVYRIRLNNSIDSVEKVDYYTEKDGLPSRYNINVFKVKGKIIFASDTSGIYEFVPQNNRFESSAYFNLLFSPIRNLSFIREDYRGNIWYVSNNKVGVLRIQEDFSFQHVTSPFTLLTGKFLNGFESVYPFSEDHLFFGIENGFAHYSPQAYYLSYTGFSAYITRADAIYLNRTFYFGNSNPGYRSRQPGYSFPFKHNSFRFSFSSPVYDNPGNIEYSYNLSGYSDNWSAWSSDFSQEFIHLPEGKFTFMVKARNQLGIESLSDSLAFTVMSPWFKSIVAYIVYSLILISLAIFLIWAVNKRIEISNRKVKLKELREYREKEREYIKQALQSEKEIISMKNEKLRIEMIQQDKELANQAMNLIRKSEVLLKIKEELMAMKKASNEELVSEKIVSLISKINKEVGHNKQREVFEKAFDEVHEEFLNKLKSRYPSLTPTELRLCAYLKMNISTKEIAPLMNISVRGVEICRYRVRKKLGIDRMTNLASLLINL